MRKYLLIFFVALSLILSKSCLADDGWYKSLMDAADVDKAPPANGEALLWDSVDELWRAGAVGTVSDTAYSASWNGTITVAPSKNAVYDKIEAASIDTSAKLAAILTDETGSGLAVFGTSPTFTTSIISPLVIGGTATTSDLSLQTTSGIGATGADMHFLVGNNGATEAMTVLNSGKVGIGTTVPTAVLHLKAGTATVNTAPLKFNSGTLLTTAEAGAVEFLTDAFYGTITTGAARKTFAFLESPIFTGTVTVPTPFTLGAVSVLPTGTELNYVDGVTSAIQAQIDGKQGTLTNSAGLAAALSDETGTGAAVFSTSPVFSSLVDNQTNNSATATVTELYRLTHTSTGTTAANFGAGIDTYLEDSFGNAAQQASRIATIWTDPTEASEDSAIVFSGVSAGGALTEWGRVLPNKYTFGNGEWIENNTNNGQIRFENNAVSPNNNWLNIDLGQAWQWGVTLSAGGGSGSIIRFNSNFMVDGDISNLYGSQSDHNIRLDSTGNDALEISLREDSYSGRQGSGYLQLKMDGSSEIGTANADTAFHPTLAISSSLANWTARTNFWHNGYNGYIEPFTGGLVIVNRNTVDTEKITNGTFTGSASSWTLGTGWAYSANTVVKNADGTGTLSQTSAAMATPLVAGEVYALEFTVSSMTVGSFTPSVGGETGIAITYVSATVGDTFQQIFTATSTADLIFTPSNTSRFTIDNISLKKITDGDLRVVGDVTVGGALILPNGANPTVDAAGEIAQDTTDNQLLYGATPRVIPYEYTRCIIIENLAAADDNYPFGMFNDPVTITGIGVHCDGTCTTAADIDLSDRAANAMTHGAPTVSVTTGNTTFTAVTAANTLVAGEGLEFSVANAVSPETDKYLICYTYTVDRQ